VQNGLNMAMLANPLFWVAAAIGFVIALIYKWIQSVGGIKNAWEIFKLSLAVAWNWIKVAFFTGVYFVIDLIDKLKLCWEKAKVAIADCVGDMKVKVLTIIQNMVNGGIDIINKFIEKLNKIPGVSLDTIQHVTFATKAAAENEAAKQARANDLAAYEQDLADAKAERDKHLDDLKSDLQNSIDDLRVKISASKISQAVNDGLQDAVSPLSDTSSSSVSALEDIKNNAEKTAGNTGAMKDSMEIAEEDLKYMRDIAEREVINRFTTAEIKIDMTNNNTINGEQDIDGIVEKIGQKLAEEVDISSEGVHR
jgi:hypothetical protein